MIEKLVDMLESLFRRRNYAPAVDSLPTYNEWAGSRRGKSPC
jgi:hypothetical protein